MILGILQARMTSTRLPGKVLKQINGKPMIHWQIMRTLNAKSIDNLVVATSTDPSDDLLCQYLDSIGIPTVRGSLEDVKERFDLVLSKYEPEVFVRLTADCPLVMPEILDTLVEEFMRRRVDYLSNTLIPTYPDGLDIEVIRTSAFNRLMGLELSKIEREHVTYALYTRGNLFSTFNYENNSDLSSMRWTVDYLEDFHFVEQVFKAFQGQEATFGLPRLLEFLSKDSTLKSSIDGRRRNESLLKELGDKNE
jgi:spore coat polysaccharide biosynthesis protein SpsF